MTNNIKKIVGAVFIFAILYFSFVGGSKSPANPVQGCSVSDISIKSTKAKWVNSCHTKQCFFLKGVAVLNNACTIPTGAQIKMTGYDKDGHPVATRGLWPASIKNIAPGDYTFSLDGWLDYDRDIVSFELEPIEVKSW